MSEAAKQQFLYWIELNSFSLLSIVKPLHVMLSKTGAYVKS